MEKTKHTNYLEAKFLNYYDEVIVRIFQNGVTNKFHFFDFGLCGTPWEGEEIVCNNFYEAFDYFFKYDDFNFYEFKITNIDPRYKFFYTKKLIEKLNEAQHDWTDNIPIKNFKENLGVEIKLIENASKKGIKIINVTKNNNKHFFVGKLSIKNSSILVKNELDDILFFSSNENLTVETERIQQNNYWYFEK